MARANPLTRRATASDKQRGKPVTRLLVVAAASAMLAACGSPNDTAVAEEELEAPSQGTATGDLAGTYEIKLSDGTVSLQTINADGTYVEATADGTQTGGGRWRTDDKGQMCFDPEGDAAEECYAGGEPGEDGSFEVRSEDGRLRSSVRKLEGDAPADTGEETPSETAPEE